MDRSKEKLDKLLDLLAMRACEPLSHTEELELNHLLDAYPEYTPDHFEPIAALADASFYVNDDLNLSSMPEAFKRKILNDFNSANGSSYLQTFKDLFQAPKLAWAMTCLLAIGTSISMIEFRNYETNYRNLPVKKPCLSSLQVISSNTIGIRKQMNSAIALEKSYGAMMVKGVSLHWQDYR